MDPSFRSDRIEAAVRKRRTHQSRRRKNEQSPYAKSLSSDDINLSSDDNPAMNPKRKEVSVNLFVKGDTPRNRGPIENAAAGSKVKKVKLIVGGVTRTIQANSSHIEPSSLKTELQAWKKSKSQTISPNELVKKKTNRVVIKRPLEGDLEEDYKDDEIRYLEKLKKPKMRKISFVSKSEEDADYNEDDELASEQEESPKKQRISTTRQQAKGGVPVELSAGLLPAPPRKQKERLSATESQLKKAEAAERRRLQSEKAARESEAEAIRKILGQDSGKKKRIEKIKMRLEILAREKAANSLSVAADTIRWVMRPTGTVVTFPAEGGLPSLFSYSGPRYPPLREQCAGPECSNPYRYRDSKSKLPLCSLQCYKAIQLPS